MKLLSVAFIGAGNIAGGYDEKKISEDIGIYSHAGAYVKHGGFALKTVFDINHDRAKDFCRIWDVGGVVFELAAIYGGYHDIVSVCTPDHTHFNIVRDILLAGCCRTVLVEKPLATDILQIDELIKLGETCGINVVVNFQRRNEAVHRDLSEKILLAIDSLLSVNCHYMKGLQHIGITMIDAITYLCGYPEAVLTFNRVFNQESQEYSYEFVLYYEYFTVVVKTTDADRFFYNYHMFEIDLLFKDRRCTLVDISQGVKNVPVTGYAYSDVKVINECESHYQETSYKTSMVDAVAYLYNITIGKVPHTVNTAEVSWNNLRVINLIIDSYERGSVKLQFGQDLWKK